MRVAAGKNPPGVGEELRGPPGKIWTLPTHPKYRAVTPVSVTYVSYKPTQLLGPPSRYLLQVCPIRPKAPHTKRRRSFFNGEFDDPEHFASPLPLLPRQASRAGRK